MANEITVTPNVQLANGNVVDSFKPSKISINQAAPLLWKRVVTLTAGSDTSITGLIAGITTYGICYLWNLDPTNYVQVGPDNSGAILPMIRLNPNDIPAVFRLEPGITWRAKAHTGNCNVLMAVYDD